MSIHMWETSFAKDPLCGLGELGHFNCINSCSYQDTSELEKINSDFQYPKQDLIRNANLLQIPKGLNTTSKTKRCALGIMQCVEWLVVVLLFISVDN